MPGYTTPQYDYARGTADLTLAKSLEDSTQAFGRFLGQQRYRRGLTDNAQQFQRSFPKIGAQANARGVFNSGIRRGYQRDAAQDYSTATTRLTQDETAEQGQYGLNQNLRDVGFQAQLLALYEEMQRQRATQPPAFPTA